ncbi:MAG: DNA-protecting protein DprA [Oscillospiraceae bacterium]|nr:DNA-protecting protein DprA [Oscillospiraceae bacterium]
MLTSIKYWLWLTTQLDPLPAWKVFCHFGSPEKAYFSDPEEYERIEGLSPSQRQLLEDKSPAMAEQVLERCDRENIRILTYADTDYPQRLRNIEVPPLVLYLRGRLLRLDEQAVIAVAGTRKATPYGVRNAGQFSAAITKGGGIVATGVVAGCDEAAARGALQAGGPLLCVMAGGVDLPYYDTEDNRALLRDIAARGLIVSELPPGTPHKGSYFRRRNTILCALSVALLCVEAGERSGTLGVAALAAEQGKDIFAIPANLGSRQSAGTNDLLRQGLAMAVTGPQDILSRYPFLIQEKQAAPDLTRWSSIRLNPKEDPDASLSEMIEKARKKASSSSPEEEKKVDTTQNSGYIELLNDPQRYTEEERKLLQALLSGPATVETLISQTGLTAPSVSAALTLLAVTGTVEELPGGRYRLLEERLGS